MSRGLIPPPPVLGLPRSHPENPNYALPCLRGRVGVGAFRRLDFVTPSVTLVMMRSCGFAFFLWLGLVSTALAQSATPTTGNVGSATLRNGLPAGGGAVALPSVQSSGTASTPAAGTTTTSLTNSSTSTGSTSGGGGSGAGGSGRTSGGGGGAAGRGGG